MAYAVISYPELQENDFNSIQEYRKKNDEWLYHVVKPHFSFVFPVFDMEKDKFIDEIRNLSKHEKPIDFIVRCVVINKDAFSDYYHALLVPDEGFSKIVKLHDKLYSRQLKLNHRMDIDFIPHIGVGTSKDQHKCKNMVDEWNNTDFSFSGIISCLTIVNYDNNEVVDLEEISLIK